MGEGWARFFASKAGRSDITVGSAGLEAHGLNPGAVAAMAAHGVDISQQGSSVLTDEDLERADLVVTVCGHADEHCPLLPAGTRRLHMPFEDPAKKQGTEEEIDACFQEVCGQIRDSVSELIADLDQEPAGG